MESISVDLLSGLAAGAGGDAGRLAWTRLVELVRTPLPRAADPSGSGSGGESETESGSASGPESGPQSGSDPGAISRTSPGGAESSVPHRRAPVPTGELELTLLGHEAPGGLRAYTRAHALAGALSLRADQDPDFARSIERWYADARRIGMGGEAGAPGSEADGRGCCAGGGGGSAGDSGGGGGCAGLAGGGGVIVLDERFDGPFRVGPSGYSPGPAQGPTGGGDAEAGNAWADGSVGEGVGEGCRGGDEGAGAEEDDGGSAGR